MASLDSMDYRQSPGQLVAVSPGSQRKSPQTSGQAPQSEGQRRQSSRSVLQTLSPQRGPGGGPLHSGSASHSRQQVRRRSTIPRRLSAFRTSRAKRRRGRDFLIRSDATNDFAAERPARSRERLHAAPRLPREENDEQPRSTLRCAAECPTGTYRGGTQPSASISP